MTSVAALLPCLLSALHFAERQRMRVGCLFFAGAREIVGFVDTHVPTLLNYRGFLT